jgi:UDP-N-acetylmuramyl pentapeptide synthase
VGIAAAEAAVDFLLTVGDNDEARLIYEAFGDATRSQSCATPAEAAAWLRTHAAATDLILLKGSRSASMEKVIEALVSSSSHSTC